MDENELSPSTRRQVRRRKVERAAAVQDGVITRAAVYAMGLTRGEVRAELRAQRWRSRGRHCVVTHNGALTTRQRHWVAVLEAGPRGLVDGDSALVLAGLERFTTRVCRVSVPRGARIRHVGKDVDIRQSRRWSPDDRDPGPGVPRTRPAVAAVRGCLWARSDRQAMLLLTMAVQQQVVTVADVAAELLRVRRDERRALAQGLLIDLAGGIGSLGELDVLRGCRERGLPEPDSQVARRAPGGGSYYLDFRWQLWMVVVEVDGVQHAWIEQLIADSLRHNSIALAGDTVLRLPVVGLRLCPDVFFDQIEQALRDHGWTRPSDVMRPESGGDHLG